MLPRTTEADKKLSCRREIARCFASLNISLSHSTLVLSVQFPRVTLCKCLTSDAKSDNFFIHPLHLTPPVGGVLVGLLRYRLVKKNPEWWHWCGNRRLDNLLAISPCARTVRRTDRRTSCDGIVRAMRSVARHRNTTDD